MQYPPTFPHLPEFVIWWTSHVLPFSSKFLHVYLTRHSISARSELAIWIVQLVNYPLPPPQGSARGLVVNFKFKYFDFRPAKLHAFGVKGPHFTCTSLTNFPYIFYNFFISIFVSVAHHTFFKIAVNSDSRILLAPTWQLCDFPVARATIRHLKGRGM